jgi:hypothetical protein
MLLNARQRLRPPCASVCCYYVWAKRHDSLTLCSQMVSTKRTSGMVLRTTAVVSLLLVVHLITQSMRMVVWRVSILRWAIARGTLRIIARTSAPHNSAVLLLTGLMKGSSMATPLMMRRLAVKLSTDTLTRRWLHSLLVVLLSRLI